MQPETVNQQQIPALPKSARWYKSWWAILIYLFLAYILITTLILFLSTDKQELSEPGANKVDETKLFNNTFDDPAQGQRQAKIKIVEFIDYQCSFCKESFPTIREILADYKDDIYFVLRDFPVEQIHPESVQAAMAAGCALEQNKFWEYHDKLFINQDNLDNSSLNKYAQEVGLDLDQFKNCLNSNKYLEEVAQDYLDGLSLGVAGTPTFFINGYRFSGSIPKDILIKIVENLKNQ